MWLIKSEEEAASFGKNPSERTLEEILTNSIVVVDKHSGPTSHQVSQWTRDIFGIEKSGHSGTLDPAVTGVLPVALGNATKAMPVLTGLKKEYVGVMHLHQDVEEKTLRDAVSNFIGVIKQRPPKKSAVARREREREIFSFDILEIDGKDVLFRTETEAGTYIRKLCHDIGQKLGVGAHMSELRRTKAGSFEEGAAVSLVDLKDAYEFSKSGDEKYVRKLLINIEDAIPHVKKIVLKESAIPSILHGSPLYISGIVKLEGGIVAGETVAMMSQKGELVAIGIAKMPSEDMMRRKKGNAVRTDRVFIRP
jgi:H/ACA ribonucleoprotein complex subunit 4